VEVSCPVSVMKFRLTARIEARGNGRKYTCMDTCARARDATTRRGRARERHASEREDSSARRDAGRGEVNVVRLVRVGERVRERRAGARSRTSARCRARGLRGVSGEW